MSKTDYNTGEYIIIYAYSLPDVTTHRGHLKIGKASIKLSKYALADDKNKAVEAAVRARIKDQVGTPDLNYNLEFFDLAITNNGKSFMDYDVHSVLQRSGFEKIQHTKDKTNGEWFNVSLEIAKNAFKAVQEGRQSLNPDETTSEDTEIEFRKGSQTVAIQKTLAAINKGKKHYLWDAKMRFGKTLTSLEVARQMGYGKVLIITHRPEVSEDWFNDFNLLFRGTKYRFGSRNKGENIKSLNKNFSCDENGKNHNPFVYFASIQYLRNQVMSEEKASIFSTDWDMLIIDEADEGVKTTLADEIISQIQRNFTLMLSGTPFNLLEDYNEDEIFSWDYTKEQELKKRWEELYPNEPNPYYKLPRLTIYTYELDKYLETDEFKNLYDKAFNFKEFFRTNEKGDFVHERYVYKFLNLITTPTESNFPYSSYELHNNLRHTLWMVPGVKEARALEKLLEKHPIFGMRDNAGERIFNVANIAGDGNEEVAEKESRKLVRKAITKNPRHAYSITISCGKMTRGVSIPEWSAVFMLNNTSSASTYMQTVFRAQTPWENEGVLKTDCYVFDFAPDRTLNVIAETMNIKKKRPTKQEVKDATRKFLNFCPVISATDGRMDKFSTTKLLHAIKRVAIQKVTRNGFDDTRLYNLENLSRCTDEELQDFAELNRLIGKNSSTREQNKITLADNGFNEEEYEKAKEAERKKKERKELTPEEKELLKRKREIAEQRRTRISILRGISIRMPMLIYGCKIDNNGHEIKPDDEISLKQFINIVDDDSWKEFMPEGVTKEMLRDKFARYYDEEVFIGAGIDIRLRALAADRLAPSERVMEISELFKGFKNPDKETVLTPWPIVNMHITSTLGGSDFNHIIEFDDEKDQPGEKIGLPNWVDKDKYSDIWSNKDAKILEINSKSGLYPLLCTYNFYTKELSKAVHNKSTTEEDAFRHLWSHILKNNIYVITKSPMAKSITERTLAGYEDMDTNVIYIPDLVNKLKKHDENLKSEIASAFGLKGGQMLKFDAVVGNPPYQIEDNGGMRENGTVNASASPIYNMFVEAGEELGNIVSMIMPARWLSGAGKGLNEFSKKMIASTHLKSLDIFPNSKDVFPSVDIKGGICYVLLDNNYNGKTNVVIHNGTQKTESLRSLDQTGDGVFIMFPELASIFEKVKKDLNNRGSIQNLMSVRKPYGLSTDIFRNPQKYNLPSIQDKRQKEDDLEIWGLEEGNRTLKYIPKNYPIPAGRETVGKWKVFVPYAYGCGAIGEKIPTPILGTPIQICTETFLRYGAFDTKAEAEAALSYLKTKFFRVLVGILKTTQHSTTTFKFVPIQDFTKNSDIDWLKPIPEIDQQLYKKYGLSKEEIDFIEEKVQSMG